MANDVSRRGALVRAPALARRPPGRATESGAVMPRMRYGDRGGRQSQRAPPTWPPRAVTEDGGGPGSKANPDTISTRQQTACGSRVGELENIWRTPDWGCKAAPPMRMGGCGNGSSKGPLCSAQWCCRVTSGGMPKLHCRAPLPATSAALCRAQKVHLFASCWPSQDAIPDHLE